MRLLPFDYAVRNLARSPRRMAAILFGNALVVLLIVSAAAFVQGMKQSLSVKQNSANVILLGVGSEESIERSQIPAATTGVLAASVSGIQSIQGIDFISPEILSALIIRSAKDSTEELRAVVRGITPSAFLVHSRVQIVEGRAPQSGSNEILAGSLAAEKLGLPANRLAIGQSLWIDGRPWEIVGRFQARGTVMDAEIWVPLSDLQVATKRDTLSCVVVTLGSAEFADIDGFAKTRLDLELSAVSEKEYYAGILEFYRPIQLMIWITAILVALAAVLGGFNTLYAAFSSRVRELGMLQSLGFSRRAIVASLMQEALLASSLALLIALLIAKVCIDGFAISFSMGVFQLTINSTVLAAGATVGILLGIIGALPPAWRCLRLPITEALKSS